MRNPTLVAASATRHSTFKQEIENFSMHPRLSISTPAYARIEIHWRAAELPLIALPQLRYREASEHQEAR